MLNVHKLEAFYGDFQALFGVDFKIGASEKVAIIGSNGAGKSTFLKALCGQLTAGPQMVKFQGQPIGGMPTNEIAAKGIAMVPEGRRLFPSLSVEENLRVGAYAKRPGPWNLKKIYDLFPVLEEKKNNLGGELSGGQQQMVAIGRALMSNPALLMCDEISLGLAPIVVKDIYAAMPAICADGLAVIIVEQDIDTAISMSDRVYCFMHGRVSLHGSSKALSKHQISAAYFGLSRTDGTAQK